MRLTRRAVGWYLRQCGHFELNLTEKLWLRLLVERHGHGKRRRMLGLGPVMVDQVAPHRHNNILQCISLMLRVTASVHARASLWRHCRATETWLSR